MLNYTVRGAGRHAIIFLHGASQSLEVWDSITSDSSFSDKYMLISVDLPGHGKSVRSNNPGDDYTLGGLAAHVAAFINELGLSDYIIVAASVATNITAEALPSLNCRGLFFVGCSVIGGDLLPSDIMLPDPATLVTFTALPSEEQFEDYLDLMVVNKNDTAERDHYKKTFYSTDKAFRQVLGESIGRGEWRDELLHLQQSNLPLALIYGQQEGVLQTNYLKDVSLDLWRGDIISIPGAGHNVHIDQPQSLVEMIAAFGDECFK